jgi:hypothetical protein
MMLIGEDKEMTWWIVNNCPEAIIRTQVLVLHFLQHNWEHHYVVHDLIFQKIHLLHNNTITLTHPKKFNPRKQDTPVKYSHKTPPKNKKPLEDQGAQCTAICTTFSKPSPSLEITISIMKVLHYLMS